MLAAVHRARELAPGREAVCVSHQLPIWTLRRFLTGQHLWHDPRRRQCALASLTSLVFDDAELVQLRYTEPAGRSDPDPDRRMRPPARGARVVARVCWRAAPPARTRSRPGRTSPSSPRAGRPRSSTTRRRAAGRCGRCRGRACSTRARRSGSRTSPGRVVVLNIWGSWCGPCRAEAPDLQFVAQQTAADGVSVLGIDVRDDRARGRRLRPRPGHHLRLGRSTRPPARSPRCGATRATPCRRRSCSTGSTGWRRCT